MTWALSSPSVDGTRSYSAALLNLTIITQTCHAQKDPVSLILSKSSKNEPMPGTWLTQVPVALQDDGWSSTHKDVSEPRERLKETYSYGSIIAWIQLQTGVSQLGSKWNIYGPTIINTKVTTFKAVDNEDDWSLMFQFRRCWTLNMWAATP